MDDFVKNKLNEWNLQEYIDTFEEHEVDSEALYCLEEENIQNLIPKEGPKARFKKHLQTLKGWTHQSSGENLAVPCTSSQDNVQRRKRKSDSQDKSITESPPAKRVTRSASDVIRHKVKEKMSGVLQKTEQSTTDFSKFLTTKIKELETDKKEQVGVFGRSGAGKSSLINAIIEEKSLLPTGVSKACTSAMIKIEANTESKYEAQIEFTTKEEWKEEWWFFVKRIESGQTNKKKKEEDDDDDADIAERLRAVYGEGWKQLDDLLDDKHFKEIQEFCKSQPKTIKCNTAKKLSKEWKKFVTNETTQGENKGMKCFWPLVKCVTLKVPNSELLKDVTLVDLPGNGDRNKSRDEMWKSVIQNCSTVWIVTEATRAASEKEAWDILESASFHMGNGGQCQQIHFICNKSDMVYSETQAKSIKDEVKNQFRKEKQINKYFSEDEDFKVFTVSAKDSLEAKRLDGEVNEMSKLQNVLRDLNDHHSKSLHYVSGAEGILSLIDGARRGGEADKQMEVRQELVNIINREFRKVQDAMEKAIQVFEDRLTEGVKESKNSCGKLLNSVINAKTSSFYNTLKSVVEKGGVHKPKKRKQINLNRTLSSVLTESIDQDFMKTFPNEKKRGAFNDAINKFSLDTENLINNNRDFELQLKFIKTEEDKMKTKLNTTIRDQKKKIYHSLTETIKNNMKDGYERAKKIEGKDSLKHIREELEAHVETSKDDMFGKAKEKMLKQLEELKVQRLKEMKDSLIKSVDLSLTADDTSIPDVSDELEAVKELHEKLKSL